MNNNIIKKIYFKGDQLIATQIKESEIDNQEVIQKCHLVKDYIVRCTHFLRRYGIAECGPGLSWPAVLYLDKDPFNKKRDAIIANPCPSQNKQYQAIYQDLLKVIRSGREHGYHTFYMYSPGD